MKKFISLFFVILTFTVTCNTFAQSSKIEINYSRPPLNSLKSADLWAVRITNSGDAITAYLFGSMTNNENGELIATGQTMTFEVKKGTTNFKVSDLPKIPDVNYLSKDPKYKQSFMNTGGAPPGDYKICVELRYTNNTVAGEDCFDQKIMGGDAPQLISPRDEEEILVDAPVFTWMYMKQQGTNQTYKLKIVEVKGDESPENAMLKNKAFFEKEGITMQMLQYPTTAPKFEEGKKYAWMVSAGDIKHEILSELFLFSKNSSNKNGNQMIADLQNKDTEPEAIKTETGWEFKNLNFTDDEKKTLLDIYSNREKEFRLVEFKDGVATESYGNADISRVKIISKGSGDEQKRSTWVISKTLDDRMFSKQAVKWETAKLPNDIREKINAIMSKYNTELEKPKPEANKTETGWEFKNLNFTDDEKKTLLDIYSNREKEFRLVEFKDGVATESYGNADISRVKIISKGSGDEQKRLTWAISKTLDDRWFTKQAVVWETAKLPNDIREKINAIMSKYKN